jgi:hypothetical protein
MLLMCVYFCTAYVKILFHMYITAQHGFVPFHCMCRHFFFHYFSKPLHRYILRIGMFVSDTYMSKKTIILYKIINYLILFINNAQYAMCRDICIGIFPHNYGYFNVQCVVAYVRRHLHCLCADNFPHLYCCTVFLRTYTLYVWRLKLWKKEINFWLTQKLIVCKDFFFDFLSTRSHKYVY